MSNTGFLYSCAALIINGLLVLGLVSSRAALPINILVGSMQVIFPTLMLIQAGGDPAVVLSAASAYLFGFTYLYLAFNEITGASGEGLGWFSFFVTVAAAVFSALKFIDDSPVYGVLWLGWGFLWFLFYLMLARGNKRIERMAGWLTLLLGIFTVGVPGVLELAGVFPDTVGVAWLAAVLILSLTLISWVLGRRDKRASAEALDLAAGKIS